MKLASDFVPTVVVIVVFVLLAFWIVHESDKNNKEVIEAVRQAQVERRKSLEQAIQQGMENPELWLKLQNQMKEAKAP